MKPIIDSESVCMGAMGYYPALFIDHGLKRAWFSSPDLIDYDSDSESQSINLERAEHYGSEIEYNHACQIILLMRAGFNLIR